jgi:rRNA biogenesis protein RRP5
VESLLSNDKTFKVSSVHQGRVTGYNPVDNLYLVSFEQKVLDQKFLRLEDVELGSTLEGTIEKAGDSGITVTLAEGITGWIPMQHSSDVLPGTDKKKAGKELLKWNKKFKEGSKIKCKVISTSDVL